MLLTTLEAMLKEREKERKIGLGYISRSVDKEEKGVNASRNGRGREMDSEEEREKVRMFFDI